MVFQISVMLLIIGGSPCSAKEGNVPLLCDNNAYEMLKLLHFPTEIDVFLFHIMKTVRQLAYMVSFTPSLISQPVSLFTGYPKEGRKKALSKPYQL